MTSISEKDHVLRKKKVFFFFRKAMSILTYDQAKHANYGKPQDKTLLNQENVKRKQNPNHKISDLFDKHKLIS